nr:hypothetical protein BSM_01760 [uncultured archaeon]CBH39639.1 hypothetical protein BSM_31180 [uncultured archaeon]
MPDLLKDVILIYYFCFCCGCERYGKPLAAIGVPNPVISMRF